MGASEVRGTEDQNYAPEPPGPFVTAPKKLTSAARAGAGASVCVRVCVDKRKDYVDQTHREHLYCLYSLVKKPVDI